MVIHRSPRPTLLTLRPNTSTVLALTSNGSESAAALIASRLAVQPNKMRRIWDTVPSGGVTFMDNGNGTATLAGTATPLAALALQHSRLGLATRLIGILL